MTESDGTYNGWRNRATWAVHLWLSNDPETYSEARAAIRSERLGIDRDRALRDHVQDLVHDSFVERDPYGRPAVPGLARDLLDLSGIDWTEITDALTEGAEPEEEYDVDTAPAELR